MSLDDIRQLHGQLYKIGNIQIGITVNAFYVFLVAADSGRNKQNAFSLILLFDPPQVLLRSTAGISVICRLTVR